MSVSDMRAMAAEIASLRVAYCAAAYCSRQYCSRGFFGGGAVSDNSEDRLGR